MKITYRGIVLCVAIVLACCFSVDQVAAFGEGCWSACLTGGRVVTVAPYGKIGYQSLSVNLNIPVPDPFVGLTSLHDMDAKIQNQGFLIASLGVNSFVGNRLGLFLEGSVSAPQAGSLNTFFSDTSTPNLPTNPTGYGWPAQRVQWWEVNLGGSLNLRDYGDFLLGFKFDQLSENLTTPGAAYITGGRSFEYNGDMKIQTWSPYIGLRLDDKYWRFDLIWSPWLTSYNAQMPLRFFRSDTGGTATDEQEAKYALSGGGGNLFEAYGEGKFTLFELLAAKLWLKGSWLKCRSNGSRDYVGIQPGFLPLTWSASDSADSSLTRYLWALGLAGEIKF